MNKRQRKKENSLQYAFFGYEKFRKYDDFPVNDPVVNRKRLYHLEHKRYRRDTRKQAKVIAWRNRKAESV